MNRRTLTLETANRLITQDRAEEYGSARKNFGTIAALWSEFLGCDITPTQVSLMMVLLKIARAKVSPPKQDSYDDMCGYAALAAELAIGELTDEEKSKI